MQAEPTTEGFYVDAKSVLQSGEFDQGIEDEIDILMGEENDLLEDEEIEELLQEEWEVHKYQQQMEVTPSEFTEFAIKIPVGGEIVPFSFEGRRYLHPIYNTPARNVLLKCARQTEKCHLGTEKVVLEDGSLKEIQDIVVGDRVVTLSPDESHTSVGTVTWKSERIRKPCLRVKTQQNLQTLVAETHPIRQWNSWTLASEISVGDRIASLRKGGVFTGKSTLPDNHVKFAAYMIGDGCCGVSNNFNFTKSPGPVLSEFEGIALSEEWAVRESKKKGTDSLSMNLGQDPDLSKPRVLLEEWGLWGKSAEHKFLPEWVWGLDRRQSALFLNRLWSTDGGVKQVTRSSYEITYSSISQRLVKDVQRLLWKFGIPSRIRSNKPKVYDGTDKAGYILLIKTQDGITSFLSGIGALGKSEGVPLPSVEPNNNRDTYPLEINQHIREIVDSKGDVHRFGRNAHRSLRSVGLRETLQYPPTRRKLQKYVEFFREDSDYNQTLVEELALHLDTDIYWDRVTAVEEIGDQWCYDISVSHGESYVVDGIITHNSTMLGNKSISYSGINLAFKTLYVSSTATQAQVFSVDRIKEPIDISPELSFMLDSKLSQNVLFKQFKNRSQIRIRYAYLNADRVRGIPADHILIDEIQDIIYENIPVIEQCASHSPWKLTTYSGTPKTLDNTIELYWSKFSTQNEWVVPCESCGSGKDKSTWHWNILGMKNIGKHGLICSKCKRPIFPTHPDAQWASMNPVTSENRHLVTYEGYRIPQLMVPWIEWNDILVNLEKYDTARFYNEVLGLSYDSGVRPLTRAQVKTCCRDTIHFNDVIENAEKCSEVFAGLDWGCYDDQTQILTDTGFKYFKDLTNDDQVAQFDKDSRMMSFVKPEVRTVRDWTEPLYHTTGRGIDMMLTGTHRMLFQGCKGGSWLVDSMESFSTRSQAKLRGYVDWEGEDIKSFTLPGLPKSPGYSGSKDLVIDGDLWMELLGYLVSEAGLCYNKGRPSCVKMSQRAVDGDYDRVDVIRRCLDKSGLNYSEFPNKDTLDFNWTIYGKQFWKWWADNIGTFVDNIRVPRQFLNVSKRQLKILFEAMVFGDGSKDKRENNHNGSYSSTSLGLCEDFQEVCIRLGVKSTRSLHKEAEGNRKTRYRVSWSGGRDFDLNNKAMKRIKRVQYNGKVYCCKVPTGFIVTERNGCIAYQGNTGEQNSFTVLSLGGYMPDIGFTIFFTHRFVGEDLEPRLQLEKIARLLTRVNFRICGADYGGGFDRNDWLMRNFGPMKLVKYQYAGNPKYKVRWQPALARFILHRTEIMSDIFNAVKYRRFSLPHWEEFRTPYGDDMLNIFSEYNHQIKMTQYKNSPGKADDTFHSILYCVLASMIVRPRPDIIIPIREGSVDFTMPLAA